MKPKSYPNLVTRRKAEAYRAEHGVLPSNFDIVPNGYRAILKTPRKKFKPSRRPTPNELEDAAKLDRFLSEHKRLKPPPHEFGPFISRRVVVNDIKPLFAYPE